MLDGDGSNDRLRFPQHGAEIALNRFGQSLEPAFSELLWLDRRAGGFAPISGPVAYASLSINRPIERSPWIALPSAACHDRRLPTSLSDSRPNLRTLEFFDQIRQQTEMLYLVETRSIARRRIGDFVHPREMVRHIYRARPER